MDGNYTLVNTDDGVKTLVKDLSSKKVLYVDTETNGLDPYNNELLLIQISGGKGQGTSVIPYKILSTESKGLLKELFLGRELVFHNAKFDLKFLYMYIDLPIDSTDVKVFDTQLAECVLMAGRSMALRRDTSLKNTLRRRYSLDLDKEVRQEFIGHSGKEFTDAQIEYAAKDVEVLADLRKDQIEEAKEWGLIDTLRLEFDLVKHVAVMELNGVSINRKLWKKLIKEQVVLKEETYQELKKACMQYVEQQGLFGELPLKINSQQEMLAFLQERVGLDIHDTREETLSYTNHPICDLLLEYRGHEKLIKAFGEGLLQKINKATGRLYAEFNQCSTATGRFSSSNPNVQQIPSRGAGAALRNCFVAPQGHKLICADYSQIELRILAELSQEPKMIEAYNRGFDGHTNTASVAFGVPLEKVTGDQRKVAKILNFATVYGGGPPAIAKGMAKILSVDDATKLLKDRFGKDPDAKGAHHNLAKEFVTSYFQGLPKAQEFLMDTGKNAVYNRYSETPLGRKRFYDTEFNYVQSLRGTEEYEERLQALVASVERRGKNHPIQGCSADITKLAIMKLGECFRERYDGAAKIILQVHDEIVVECPEEISEEVSVIQNESMVWAAKQFLTAVPVEVDVHIADIWEKE